MNRNRQTHPQVTLGDVYLAMSRHRRKAILFFLAVLTATALVTIMTPKAYVSESKLLIRLGRENAMLDPAATLGTDPVVAVPASRENEINSVAEMLQSRSVLERVVDELGPEVILDGLPAAGGDDSVTKQGFAQWLERTAQHARRWVSGTKDSLRSLVSTSNLSDRDQAIERMEENLQVKPVRKSNIVAVSYEASQPELAQRVVTVFVDAYLKEHVRVSRTPGTHELFSEHTKRLSEELASLEEELRELKTTTGLASVDQQREQIVTRLGRLEDELLTAEAARAEAEAKVSALRENLENLPKEQVVETSTGLGHHGTDLIRNQLFALQLREEEASAIYTAEHPKLQTLRQELAEAERIWSEQETTRTEKKAAPDATYEQTRLALIAEEPNLVALKAKAESLRSQLADIRESLQTLNANEVRIAKLKREVELREVDYRKYAMNMEQARIDHAMEAERMTNISVVQPASLDPRAIRPRKALNLLLGLIVAMGGAVGLALLAEYFDRSLQLPEGVELERKAPPLSSPPRISRGVLKVNGKK